MNIESRSPRDGRQRILEVAEDLFTERGYRAVSIRAIAEGCGITSAALYYHFPSKEALFAAVLEQHAERLTAHMRRAGEAAGTHRERAAAMLGEYARVAADRRSPLFLLRREREAGDGGRSSGLDEKGVRAQHARLLHALLLPLDEVLRQAMANGELSQLPEGSSPAALLVGMLHGQIQYRHACLGEKITGEDIQLVVKVFWEGVQNPHEER